MTKLAVVPPAAPAPPPWRPIGTEPGNGTETVYVFEVDGVIVKMRQAVLGSQSGIMSLDPDAERWRRMFPHPTNRAKVDMLAVIGFLITECRAAQRRREAERAKAGQ